jgi:hypothetical protein
MLMDAMHVRKILEHHLQLIKKLDYAPHFLTANSVGLFFRHRQLNGNVEFDVRWRADDRP